MISCSSRLVEARTSSSTSWTYAGSASGPWSNTSVTEVGDRRDGALQLVRGRREQRSAQGVGSPVHLGFAQRPLEPLRLQDQRHLIRERPEHPGFGPGQRRTVPHQHERAHRFLADPQRQLHRAGRLRHVDRLVGVPQVRHHVPQALGGARERRVTTSGRSGASARSRLRSKSRRTSASRASAAAARSRANADERRDHDRHRQEGEQRGDVLGPFEGERAVGRQVEEVVQRGADHGRGDPGSEPPSHDAATTGTRQREGDDGPA